jgi:hypothetical protein
MRSVNDQPRRPGATVNRRPRSSFLSVRARLAIGVIVLGVALVSAGAQGASLGGESWYDAEHGWRIRNSNIQESNDGGATWKSILAHPLIDTNTNGVLRTGLRAGLYYEGGTRGSTVQWTNDGRRFFYSPQLRQPATGEGRFLFFWVDRVLFRATPWPFPSACLASTPTGLCIYAPSKGKKRVARFTVTRVGALSDGIIGGAATVPGGVIAVSHAATTPSFLEARWLGAGGPSVTAGPLPSPENVKLDSCETRGHWSTGPSS